MLQIPGDAIAVFHDLSHAMREDSDGGKKITIAEAEQIVEALAKLGLDIAQMIAKAKQHQR